MDGKAPYGNGAVCQDAHFHFRALQYQGPLGLPGPTQPPGEADHLSQGQAPVIRWVLSSQQLVDSLVRERPGEPDRSQKELL